MHNSTDQRSLIAAGTLLGIGLGGFVDGIVFHQLLQAHNMLTARYPETGVEVATLAANLEINMFWGGLFHSFCWATTALGLVWLWLAIRRPEVSLSNEIFVGSLLFGAGLFNLVEGLIDHEMQGIHHVIEAGNHLLWDVVFLGSGVALMLAGWAVIRAGRHDLGAARGVVGGGAGA